MGNQRGQASTEYVGVIAIVAVVLAVVGTVVATPGIPRAVAHTIRMGICIVGGDVCSTADAEARGLEPCVTAEDALDHESELGAVVQAIGNDHWSVSRASDGLWTLDVAAGGGVGGGLDSGIHVKGVQLGFDASVAGRYRRMLEWRLPEAQMRAVLARVEHPEDLVFPWVARGAGLPHASRTYDDVRADAGASASAEARGLGLTAGTGAASLAVGRASGGGPTTWYLKGTASLSSLLPGVGFSLPAGMIEYRETTPPALVVRAASTRGSTEVDQLLTWPLRDRADGEAVVRVLTHPGSASLRALRDRLRREALVERRTYRTSTQSSQAGLQVLGIGARHTLTTSSRRLVDARLVSGPVGAVRYDCLGLGRS